MSGGVKKAGKRAAKKAATRAKLISKARALFVARGYEAVTIRNVAAAVEMSTGAIFANFKDKAALYEAAMGMAAPDVNAFLERLGALATTAPIGVVAHEARVLRQQLLGAGR